jgi:hypothetical protein
MLTSLTKVTIYISHKNFGKLDNQRHNRNVSNRSSYNDRICAAVHVERLILSGFK